MAEAKDFGLKGWISGAKSKLKELEPSDRVTSFDKHRIVILPFANISPDPADEYFADGMTEELIATLSQIRDLRVIARTSSMHYKGEKKSAAEIGKELSVGSMIEGSVRRAGNRLRITVQLLDTRTEEHLWSQNYDRSLEDVFAIQSEIAQNVSREMRAKLFASVKQNIEKGLTPNMEAYSLYLQGKRVMWRFDVGTREAQKIFEKAISLDPNFAAAMTELAKCHGMLGYSLMEPMQEEYEKVKKLCSKALELDDLLPAAHESMARTMYYVDWNWEGALRENRRALELDPNSVDAHFTACDLRINLGPIEEALREAQIGSSLDPVDPRSDDKLAEALLFAGRYDDAASLWRALQIAEPEDPSWSASLGYLDLLQGKFEDAIKEFENAQKQSRLLGRWSKRGLGYAYASVGRKQDAMRILSELEEMQHSKQALTYDVAIVRAGLGNTNETLNLLERAYNEHAVVFQPLLTVEPLFAGLRQERRFMALLKKLNLPANLAI